MYTGYNMPANKLQENATHGWITPCKIYNVFEKDITKKIIKECDSRADAAQFLMIQPEQVTKIIQGKSRHKNKHLGIVVTIR